MSPFINPAASDTGIALGAALYGYHRIANKPRNYCSISPFQGPSYSSHRIDSAIEEALARSPIAIVRIEDNFFEEASKLLKMNLDLEALVRM